MFFDSPIGSSPNPLRLWEQHMGPRCHRGPKGERPPSPFQIGRIMRIGSQGTSVLTKWTHDIGGPTWCLVSKNNPTPTRGNWDTFLGKMA